MARADVIPGTLNATVTKGKTQNFASTVVTDMALAAKDLSAWDSFYAYAVPSSDGPASASAAIGTADGLSTGVVTLVITSADFANNGPGSSRLLITGKPTAGDAEQVLVTGTLTLIGG